MYLCCQEGEAVVIEGGAGTDGPPSLAQLAPPHSPAHEAVAAEEAPAPSSAVSPSTGSSASEDDYEYDMEEFNP
ncbi:MAG: hypothetical protein P4L40_01445 [Terracidiphilus sp.]|nr:hypothetical protein [Terracidiphilus sp.]